jgi:hypothetical protein
VMAMNNSLLLGYNSVKSVESTDVSEEHPPPSSRLKMKMKCCSKTLAVDSSTWRYIVEETALKIKGEKKEIKTRQEM